MTATTSSPDPVNTLELVGSLNFSDSGETKPATFRITGTDSKSYGSWATGSNAGVVSSGPCAGHVTIASGQSGAFQNTASGALDPGLLNGSGDIVYARDVQVSLSASAPNECANQSSIPLAVALH